MQVQQPFFSVIIPTYNRSVAVRRAIGSVLAQHFTDWELLLIDDGSTDDTKEAIWAMDEPRLRYFFQKNQERSTARNAGIERAQGRYLCFLDSDDTYRPDHLSSLYSFLAAHDFPAGTVRTGYALVYPDGEQYEKAPAPVANSRQKRENILETPIGVQNCCFQQQIMAQHHFPAAFHLWEDKHLLFRAAATHPFFQLTKPTVVVSADAAPASRTTVVAELRHQLACLEDLQRYHAATLAPLMEATEFIYLKGHLYLVTAHRLRQRGHFAQAWVLLQEASGRFPAIDLLPRYAKLAWELIRRSTA